jgi:hypothetical protein
VVGFVSPIGGKKRMVEFPLALTFFGGARRSKTRFLQLLSRSTDAIILASGHLHIQLRQCNATAPLGVASGQKISATRSSRSHSLWDAASHVSNVNSTSSSEPRAICKAHLRANKNAFPVSCWPSAWAGVAGICWQALKTVPNRQIRPQMA